MVGGDPYAGDVPSPPTLRAPLLDLAGGIGMAGPALMVLYSLEQRPTWMTATVSALLAVAVVTWIVWRRSGQRSTTAVVVFAIVSAATIALGNGMLFYGIIWTACLMLGVTVSAGLVLWGYAGGLIALVVILHLGSGSPADTIFAEASGTAVMAGIGAAVSFVLRDSLRVGDALQDALAQRDAADLALRRRLDADRDLALARERERTARDLHDDLGHRLTAIGLSLDYVARVDDRDAAATEVRRARELVGDSLDAMRRLVRAMHPVELGTLRDADAFRAVAAAFGGTGIEIAVSVDSDDEPLAHEHSLLLLRFVQEGLTNVVRHTTATAVDLRIAVGGGGVRATLEDRGGPTAADDDVVEGFGIRSLRARAGELGGVVTAKRTPTGFRLVAELPVRARERHPQPSAIEVSP